MPSSPRMHTHTHIPKNAWRGTVDASAGIASLCQRPGDVFLAGKGSSCAAPATPGGHTLRTNRLCRRPNRCDGSSAAPTWSFLSGPQFFGGVPVVRADDAERPTGHLRRGPTPIPRLRACAREADAAADLHRVLCAARPYPLGRCQRSHRVRNERPPSCQGAGAPRQQRRRPRPARAVVWSSASQRVGPQPGGRVGP